MWNRHAVEMELVIVKKPGCHMKGILMQIKLVCG